MSEGEGAGQTEVRGHPADIQPLSMTNSKNQTGSSHSQTLRLSRRVGLDAQEVTRSKAALCSLCQI